MAKAKKMKQVKKKSVQKSKPVVKSADPAVTKKKGEQMELPLDGTSVTITVKNPDDTAQALDALLDAAIEQELMDEDQLDLIRALKDAFIK